jgi:ankyrin repeat protein
LHWIAQFGLSYVAKQFLQTLKEDEVNAVNATDGRSQGLLIYAAEHGYYKMAKLLLDKGADVNAQGGYFSNAL